MAWADRQYQSYLYSSLSYTDVIPLTGKMIKKKKNNNNHTNANVIKSQAHLKSEKVQIKAP